MLVEKTVANPLISKSGIAVMETLKTGISYDSYLIASVACLMLVGILTLFAALAFLASLANYLAPQIINAGNVNLGT